MCVGLSRAQECDQSAAERFKTGQQMPGPH
jgi:hypothetical protein